MTPKIDYYAKKGDNAGWLIRETDFFPEHLGKCEAIFCQGNGYLGQRAALEETYVGEKRNLFVTGTFDKFDESEVTELPNLPDMTNMEIFINGDRFRMDSGRLKAMRDSLIYRPESLQEILSGSARRGSNSSFILNVLFLCWMSIRSDKRQKSHRLQMQLR